MVYSALCYLAIKSYQKKKKVLQNKTNLVIYLINKRPKAARLLCVRILHNFYQKFLKAVTVHFNYDFRQTIISKYRYLKTRFR